MKIESFFIGIIVFGLVTFIGFSVMSSNVAEYGLNDVDTSKLERTSDQIDPIMDETSAFEGKLRGDGVTEDNTENSLFSGGFSAASNIWNSVKIMSNLTNTLAEEANIGDTTSTKLIPRIVATFMLILGILLVVGILYLVFRFKPS